jgi:hypothetical protein
LQANSKGHQVLLIGYEKVGLPPSDCEIIH